MNFFFFIVLFFISSVSFAEDSYYLSSMSFCQLQVYRGGALLKVDGIKFKDKLINVKRLPKNPNMVAFKFEEQIYVTSEMCVMSANKRNVKNSLTGNEYQKKPQDYSEREKFNTYKYYLELGLGHFMISDKNAVGGDYNSIFPSVTTNPTVWSSAEESGYKTSPSISLTAGMKTGRIRFLALKLRMLNGKKSDNVRLTDINTSAVQDGSWSYEDSFKNLYAGYKFIFVDHSRWKPLIGLYLGLSYMTSTLSDGASSFELTSIAPAGFLEAGMEYEINSHWALSGLFGFEYLGSRSLKFADESAGENFKTNMKYTNKSLNLGVKYYFK